MAGRLRRREAVLRETPPAPPSQGGAINQLAALDITSGISGSFTLSVLLGRRIGLPRFAAFAASLGLVF
jgi:hypothetical protein